MVTEEFALQLRPALSLSENPLKWIIDANTEEGGLNIPLTSFVSIDDTDDAIEEVQEGMRQLAEKFYDAAETPDVPWEIASEGVVTAPQESSLPTQPGVWFLNLCCVQPTLGFLRAHIAAMQAFAPFAGHLLRPPLDGDELGTYHLRLSSNPSALTKKEAHKLRQRILGLQEWVLTLVKRTGTHSDVLYPSPASPVPDFILYAPEAGYLSLQPLPNRSGKACSWEPSAQRPVGPFPPGKCAPPPGAPGCYHPVPGYPACCHFRMCYPLLRHP